MMSADSSKSSENRLKVLTQNFERINAHIGKAELVAVTKYSPLEDLFLAYEIGHRNFGENRVKDLEVKAKAFHDKGFHDVRWHFIGNLQSNKLNQLLKIKNLYSIHSVDSLKLLEKLYEKAPQFLKDRDLLFFLQVKTSNEEEKSGFNSKDEVYKALNFIKER
ncbi:MAG: YggS family pyridoxal phosphate-dependent enzyme, partial [Halobacteriovoraceae bacterium]|nr:YggS family pyridoxal phosphate-dependent enzyme [Halobacteriovoraceae bacterium]